MKDGAPAETADFVPGAAWHVTMTPDHPQVSVPWSPPPLLDLCRKDPAWSITRPKSVLQSQTSSNFKLKVKEWPDGLTAEKNIAPPIPDHPTEVPVPLETLESFLEGPVPAMFLPQRC